MRTGFLASAVIGALALLLAAPPGARAQRRATEPAAAPPDAKAILKEARAAIQQSRTFLFNTSIRGYGSLAGVYGVATAEITIERQIAGSPVLARIAVRGQNRPVGGGPKPIEFVYDGAAMKWRDPQGQVASAAPGEAHAALLAREEMRLVPVNLVIDEPLTHLIDTSTAALEGRSSVEGVECDAIAVEGPGFGAPEGSPPIKARLYLGVEDRLPRRVEYPLKPQAPGGTAPTEEGGFVITFAQMRVNEPIPPSAWRIDGSAAPPEPEPAPKRPPAPPLKARSALIASGQAAPDWALKDAEGNEVRLSDFKGKVVVIDFWATWCPPCREAMPEVQALHEKFRDKGVEVIGISTSERREPVTGPAAYMKDKGFTYRLLVRGDEVAKGYGVRGIPVFYVIGANGKVAFSKTGFAPGGMERVERIIEQQLKAKR